MSYAAVAERYARAIFELGSETNQLAQFSDQIRRAADTYASSAELRRVLDNPVIDEGQRESLIKDLAGRLGLSQNVQNTLRLLAIRRRLPALPEIAASLRQLADDDAGVLRATVTSAKPLPETYYQKLTTELAQRTNKKILLEKKADPSLIAGVITRIGDNTVDGSLRGRLEALQRQLVANT